MTEDNAREHAEIVRIEETDISKDDTMECSHCGEIVSKYEMKDVAFAIGQEDYEMLPVCRQCFNRINSWGYDR